MLLVPTVLRESRIQGVGIFAAKPILKGTVVWVLCHPFDVEITKAAYDSLPEIAQLYVDRYAYVSKQTGNYVMDGDHARYANHSESPNVLASNLKGNAIAARDIYEGEELTFYYPETSAEPMDFVSIFAAPTVRGDREAIARELVRRRFPHKTNLERLFERYQSGDRSNLGGVYHHAIQEAYADADAILSGPVHSGDPSDRLRAAAHELAHETNAAPVSADQAEEIAKRST